MRGNLYRRVLGDVEQGSIPACAGEPFLSSLTLITLSVYPRVCGGTVGTLTTASTGVGLSPRVRGNRDSGYVRTDRNGSIPACAGEPI